MPVRNMTDEERDRIFGNGLIIFGQVRPPIVKSKEVSEDERNLSKMKRAQKNIDIAPTINMK